MSISFDKKLFYFGQFPEVSIYSELSRHNIHTDRHRGQSLAIIRHNESIWHVCTPFEFRQYLESSFFLISLLILYIDTEVFYTFFTNTTQDIFLPQTSNAH